MEKLQQLYNGLKESGDVTVGFDEFASYYSNPENKQALYGGLKELGDVTVPFEEFDSYYFGGEKKKTQPQAGGGVLLPASSQQSGMVSGVTPTTEVSVAVESPAPEADAFKMGEVYQQFRNLAGQSREAAEKNKQLAARGNLEAVKKEREANQWRYHGMDDKQREEAYAAEDARAIARAQELATQPLTTTLLEHYQAKFPGTGTDAREIDHISKRLKGTPEGAALEAKLQTIYKRTDPNDSEQLENAVLDAKEAVFNMVAPSAKDSGIWDDYAKTNANFADYNPQGYHRRLERKIEAQYGNAGMPKDVAYKKLIDGTLDNGVMDDARTMEARLVAERDAKKADLARIEREGVPQLTLDKAKADLENADQAVKAMESQRLADVDQTISDLKEQLAMTSPPRPRVDIQADLDQAMKTRAGFINPNALVQAAYAKFQDDADAALPQGTQMEKLRKLYAEKEYDRQQTLRRIAEAEGRGGAVPFAMNEMLNTFGGLVGQTHNDDHRRLVQLEAELKDLAPIVFLNESPAVRDDMGGGFVKSLGKHAWNGLLSTMGGQGSPMSGTTRQQNALALERNLQIAGISPEALNDPSMLGIKDRTAEPGLTSGEFIGNTLGASGGLMFHILLAQEALGPIGIGSKIQGLVKAGKAALGTGKYGGAALALLGDAVESGLAYHTAGTFNLDNRDELSFMGGFFGGAAGSLGKNGFKGAKKAVAGVFGDKAADAAKVIINWGANRAGAGIGESFEETGQQLVQMWNQSNTGQEFWEKMGKQFGDFSELTKFYVSTLMMGAFMGGAHSDGLGKHLQEYADQQLAAMPPEDRQEAEQIADEIVSESEALIEGAQSEKDVTPASPET